MRIAHISDLHAARPPGQDDMNCKRWLGWTNYRLFRRHGYMEQTAREAVCALAAQRPDLVLYTGDFTQHGLAAEFAAAAELLAPLAQGGSPVLCVPGNHDLYGAFLPQDYDVAVCRLALGVRPDAFGIYHMPGVEILMLDQAVASPPLCSWGRQTLASLDRARAAWAAPAGDALRIVCGHWPLRSASGGRLGLLRGLRGADRLEWFLEQTGVQAYFCGHDHIRYEVELHDGCRQYVAPALSGTVTANAGNAALYECSPRGVSLVGVM